MADEPNQVEIHEVHTDIMVTEAVGPLNKEDVRRLVELVMQQVRYEHDMNKQRERDTAITNRVDPPHIA